MNFHQYSSHTADAARPALSHARRPAIRGAFTLIELLVVIGIIILVMALSVAAFSVIGGSRGIESAQNIVSSMLGRARAEAIRNQTTVGVAFYHDPRTDRTAMLLVSLPPGAANADDPGLYLGWTQFLEDGATANTYRIDDEVICLIDDPDGAGPGLPKPIVHRFRCIAQHDATLGNRPTMPAVSPWQLVTSGGAFVDQGGIEPQQELLPTGVGVQLINNPAPVAGAPASNDRYVRLGMILFDSTGALMHQSYNIPTTSLLGTLAGRTAAIPANAANPTYSQLGLVMYDQSAFRDLGFDEVDLVNDGAPAYDQGTFNDEESEELWLDGASPGGGLPMGSVVTLMVNRYNGTLVRGE